MGIKNILKIAKKILTKKKDAVEEPMILKTEDVIKKPEVNQDRITETTSTLTRETQLTWVEYFQNQYKPLKQFFSNKKSYTTSTSSCNQYLQLTAEISQSSATDADGSSTSVKTKRKGRSATILTSSAGVEGDATLGKKSLLGE
jgi:hypothetical protein